MCVVRLCRWARISHWLYKNCNRLLHIFHIFDETRRKKNRLMNWNSVFERTNNTFLNSNLRERFVFFLLLLLYRCEIFPGVRVCDCCFFVADFCINCEIPWNFVIQSFGLSPFFLEVFFFCCVHLLVFKFDYEWGNRMKYTLLDWIYHPKKKQLATPSNSNKMQKKICKSNQMVS